MPMVRLSNLRCLVEGKMGGVFIEMAYLFHDPVFNLSTVVADCLHLEANVKHSPSVNITVTNN